jgi:hypothetical protein
MGVSTAPPVLLDLQLYPTNPSSGNHRYDISCNNRNTFLSIYD